MDTLEPRLAARPRHITPEEWELRVDLAACYRLIAHFGWDDLVLTHNSARVPGATDQMLINPSGLMAKAFVILSGVNFFSSLPVSIFQEIIAPSFSPISDHPLCGCFLSSWR